MTITTTRPEVITVEDQSGLNALPVGTKLKSRTGRQWTVTTSGARWDDDYRSLSGWLSPGHYFPFTVVNPEILGEFRSPSVGVFTVEDRAGLDALPLGTRLKDRDGDTLTIRARGAHWDGYGYLNGDTSLMPYTVLNPEILGEFTTPRPALLKVGDRVKVRGSDLSMLLIDRTGQPLGAQEVGDLGEVTEVSAVAGKRLLTVALDKGVTTRMYDTRFERTDEPKPQPRPEFKVGDKVRALIDCAPVRAGSVGTVRRVHADRVWPLRIDFPEYSDCLMAKQEVELVVEPAFKVGDKVRVLSSPYSGDDRQPGAVGVIEGPSSHRHRGDFMVRIGGDQWAFATSELELVVEPALKKLTATLTEGDRVKVRDAGYGSATGIHLYYDLSRGDEGTLTDKTWANSIHGLLLQVDFGGNETRWVSPSQISKVDATPEPAYTYEVGDKVRVTSQQYQTPGAGSLGEVGTVAVRHWNRNGQECYGVTFGDSGLRWSYLNDWLAKPLPSTEGNPESLPVVMDEAGLDALPSGTVLLGVIDNEVQSYPLCQKSAGAWRRLNTVSGNSYDLSQDVRRSLGRGRPLVVAYMPA